MEILKFGDAPTPNRKNNNPRKPAAMVVAGLLVAMMGMSTTLAGTISISGGRVEFGQGLVSTAACDSDGITIAPLSAFTNSGSDSDTFTVSALTLSGIADTCLGKVFKIKAFAGSSNTSLAVKASGSYGVIGGAYIKIKLPTSNPGSNDYETSLTLKDGTSDSNIANVGFTGTSWSSNAGTFQITGLAISNSVTRFTIESSDYSSTNDGTSSN